ncbi:MAG: EscU/YscU/HrcU family type III secretion system export apparatus switch protein [Planctomycetes bacterium]|nr:EscU/YscU/HrcU family type III secretion system export apparatus switch protein [Planctomycetota bacterium]
MAEHDDQEKTEEATPKKREEARDKGQVAMSTDLVASLSLGAAAGVLALGGGALAERCGELVVDATRNVSALGPAEVDAQGWAGLVAASLQSMALPAALVVGPLLGVGALAGYAQAGFHLAPKAMEWELSRLSPAKGWKKIFGARGVARTLASALKITLVGTAAGWAASTAVDDLPILVDAPLGTVLSGLGSVLARVAAAAIGAFALLAFFDIFYQRWQHDRDLRMSREEVRQEHKNSEGDPHLKARIREVQRRLARQRMMADVPKATVVITNPTHVAVALRWDAEQEGTARRANAPVVVAKGVDLVAQRIKEVAREAGVPLREDVPLARALHARCEIGDEIPAALYQAVAAVLAQVWDLAPAGGRKG